MPSRCWINCTDDCQINTSRPVYNVRMGRSDKKIIIIAGPNGAGKTTFAEEFLLGEANCPDFTNADLIARGLAPFQPESAAVQAGQLMLEQIRSKVDRGESFAFETTLAGRTYARHIRDWKNAGYHVKLIFLSLPSADTAIERVRARKAQSGHGVPEEVVRHRFEAGLRNFHTIYSQLVNSWALYDNSSGVLRLIASGDNP